MRKKIDELVKEIETVLGKPVQISVETPNEESFIKTEEFKDEDGKINSRVIYPTEKLIYGSFQGKPCEVISLPTNNDTIKHDANLIEGKYQNLTALNEKIKNIKEIIFLCYPPLGLHSGLLEHLGKKYDIEEELAGGGHSEFFWPTVDGSLAHIEEWKEKRTDLYKEAVNYFLDNKTNFFFHDIVALPTGVYVQSHDFRSYEDRYTLKQKIAEVKLV